MFFPLCDSIFLALFLPKIYSGGMNTFFQDHGGSMILKEWKNDVNDIRLYPAAFTWRILKDSGEGDISVFICLIMFP